VPLFVIALPYDSINNRPPKLNNGRIRRVHGALNSPCNILRSP
jgi:hypothetical protein